MKSKSHVVAAWKFCNEKMAETRPNGFLFHLKLQLKGLHDHQNDDEDHQYGWHFVNDSPMLCRFRVLVFREKPRRFRKIAVHAGHQHDQQQLGVKPSALEAENLPRHPQTGNPGHRQGGIDDEVQQSLLHPH